MYFVCPNCYVVLFALHFCSLSRCSQWARRCWCCWCEHLISRRSCEVHEISKGTWRRRPWAWWRCRYRSFEISWRLGFMSPFTHACWGVLCACRLTRSHPCPRESRRYRRLSLAYCFMFAFSSPFFTNWKIFLQRGTLFLQTRTHSDKDISIMIPRQGYIHHGSRHHPLNNNLYPSLIRCTSLQ